ncbi:MAG: lipopolysaccharide biosynthesis protein [Bacteroidaceae bacterium]|nr:lipopolysaccharide biosynthesis protein [Bacteroidaceae bacterium]
MDNSKRIAKNSAFLYVQMALRIVVSLYTTRIILHALGAEDYGIKNVVGGVVTMFVFISDTMSSASQRFFAFEIGVGNKTRLNKYFNMTLECYLMLIMLLFIVVEIVGYWFVNYKLVIPENRIVAANWVFQFAVASFIVRMLSVPYGAMIVAYERIAFFAIIGLTDSLLTLGAAFFLKVYWGDRLIVYAFFLFLVAFINTSFCALFCRIKFKEDVRIKFFWDKPMFVELVSYSGWSLFWTLSNVVRSQGINILLNVFFNPVVNAARGIAYQVNNVINQYTNSFYQAVRPQITKHTAREEKEQMLKLMFSSSRISFFLLLIVAIPLLVKTPYILHVWLGETPQYTATFMRLVIIVAMIDALGHPPTTAICATGRIKWYHITVGSILLINLPISYILLKMGGEPYVVFLVSICMSLLAQGVRVFFMKHIHGMSIYSYLKNVLLKILLVLSLVVLCSYYGSFLFGETFVSFCSYVFFSTIITVLFSYFIGLEKNERLKINNAIICFARKNKNKLFKYYI